MMRNMATSLFLTVREKDERLLRKKTVKQPNGEELEVNLEEDGRIRTTLQKAKEVRRLVEKCITIAVRSRKAMKRADELLPREFDDFDSGNKEMLTQRKIWRQSAAGQEWAEARAPVVAAQRRVMKLLGNKRKIDRMRALSLIKKHGKQRQRGRKPSSFGIATPQRQAVDILFHILAERFEDRPGGYTRILRLAKPRLGDAGTQAILEIITPTPDDKDSDRYQRVRAAAEKPAFDGDSTTEDNPDWVSDEEVATSNEAGTGGEADWIADEVTADETAPDTEAAAEDDQADEKQQDAK